MVATYLCYVKIKETTMIIKSKEMLAPCGMNCSLCYVHHKKKKQCLGCRSSDGIKPKSCQNCKIISCVTETGYTYCYDCPKFPCVLINRLDKSYKTRYCFSLITSLNSIKKNGDENLYNNQLEKYKCQKCGCPINIHDNICSNCE